MKNKLNIFISFLGEKFNFDAHYFAKNTFWVLIGQVIASVSSFIVTVVIANYVSKNVAGDYRLIISFYPILTFFMLSGLSSAFIRSIVKGQDGTLEDALAIKKKYGVIAFLVGACIAFYFGILKENSIFGISILVMSLCLPLIETYSIYLPYLQGKQEFKYSSINSGITKLVSGLAIALIAFIFPETIYLIVGFYGTQVIVVYIQYKMLIKKFPPVNTIKDEDMVPYSKHTTFAGIFYMILGQMDKFTIYHFFGPISLASYWIASTIPQEVGRVLVTTLQVVYPKFVKGEHRDIKHILIKKLKTLTLAMLTISFIYIVLAYPFFQIFFPQYIEEVGKSIVLMFGFAVIPHMFVWQYYTAKRNTKVVYINNAADPILQVALYIILIPPFGVWGLVYAIFAKTLCMNLLAWYVLKKY